MADIVLIHGFGVGAQAPWNRASNRQDAGFSAFAPQLENGSAALFRWGAERQLGSAALNPMAWITIYDEESRLARRPETHGRLRAFLEKHQPRTVICHSMGSQLLLSTANRHGLPNGVEKIVLVQADLPIRFDLPRTDATWTNLYCPWDPTLQISAVLNGALRAGQIRAKVPGISNRLFPLRRLPNLHLSSMRDPRLIDLIKKTPPSA